MFVLGACDMFVKHLCETARASRIKFLNKGVVVHKTYRTIVSAEVHKVEQRVHVAVVLARVVQLLDGRDQRVQPVVDQLVRR